MVMNGGWFIIAMITNIKCIDQLFVCRVFHAQALPENLFDNPFEPPPQAPPNSF